MIFKLNPQLEADTLMIQELPLSRLLLMNDCRVPWLILVPRKANVQELFELKIDEQAQLLAEITNISKWAHKFFEADKMNIATLGNVVSQLHIHVIARQKQDFAWPKPVWGVGNKESYSIQEAQFLIKKIKESFSFGDATF